MRQLLLKNKQLIHLGIYGIGQLFNLVTPLLVVPYIVGVCGEENFGKAAIGMAIAFFLIVFVDYGSDIIGVKEVSVYRDNHKQLEQIFWNTYVAKLIVLLFIISISVVGFYTFSFFRQEKILFLWSLTVLIGQFLNPTWFLQGIENVSWITYLNILSKIIYLFGIFYFVTTTSDYIYINLWWGIGMITSNLLFMTLLLVKHKFKIRNSSFTASIKHLKTNFKLFSSQIFVSVQMYFPIILIGYLGNNTAAGQYRIIEQVIVIFRTYIILFFNYTFPKVCFNLKKNPEKGFNEWMLFNGFNFGFILISMIACYFLAGPIVAYFNPNDDGALVDLLKIAILFPVLLSISSPLKQLVLAWDFEHFYIQLISGSVMLHLLLMFFMIPLWGNFGVFYALLISELVVILFYISCASKNKFRSKSA